VVATPLPAIEWLASPHVRVAAGPEGFADAVDDLVADGDDAGARAARIAFANTHSWQERARPLAAAMHLTRAS
jgi:teichuronic acid biosynthesis glycosyltransferase TuaH